MNKLLLYINVILIIGIIFAAALQSRTFRSVVFYRMEELFNFRYWPSYQRNIRNKSTNISINIKTPDHWKVQDKEGSVAWYHTLTGDKVFEVAWNNPDLIYDLEFICPAGKCKVITETKTKSGLKVEILKPDSARLEKFSLPSTFLLGRVTNNDTLSFMYFKTDIIPPEYFDAVISWFSHTNY